MTDIRKRRIVVYPLVQGPVYEGNADDDTVPFDAVPLTAEYLSDRGGSPLRLGESWAVMLALRYLDEDGLTAAVDLSGASGLVMHIWHQSTAGFVDNRTEDAVIPDSGGLLELEIDGDGTAGTVTIQWHQSETLTSGVHEFVILADWTLTEAVAAGTIEVRQAVPTS